MVRYRTEFVSHKGVFPVWFRINKYAPFAGDWEKDDRWTL